MLKAKGKLVLLSWSHVSVVQLLNVLEHRNDNATSIPKRELNKLIYGPESVYARTPKIQQVGTADVAVSLTLLLLEQNQPCATSLCNKATCGGVGQAAM